MGAFGNLPLPLLISIFPSYLLLYIFDHSATLQMEAICGRATRQSLHLPGLQGRELPGSVLSPGISL